MAVCVLEAVQLLYFVYSDACCLEEGGHSVVLEFKPCCFTDRWAARLISGEILSLHSGVTVDSSLRGCPRLRSALIFKVRQSSNCLLDPEDEGSTSPRNVDSNVPIETM
jgi:hypothetical protein